MGAQKTRASVRPGCFYYVLSSSCNHEKQGLGRAYTYWLFYHLLLVLISAVDKTYIFCILNNAKYEKEVLCTVLVSNTNFKLRNPIQFVALNMSSRTSAKYAMLAFHTWVKMIISFLIEILLRTCCSFLFYFPQLNNRSPESKTANKKFHFCCLYILLVR